MSRNRKPKHYVKTDRVPSRSGNPCFVPETTKRAFVLCYKGSVVKPVTVYTSERAAEEYSFFMHHEKHISTMVVGCSVYRKGGLWVLQGPKSVLFEGPVQFL